MVEICKSCFFPDSKKKTTKTNYGFFFFFGFISRFLFCESLCQRFPNILSKLPQMDIMNSLQSHTTSLTYISIKFQIYYIGLLQHLKILDEQHTLISHNICCEAGTPGIKMVCPAHP